METVKIIFEIAFYAIATAALIVLVTVFSIQIISDLIEKKKHTAEELEDIKQAIHRVEVLVNEIAIPDYEEPDYSDEMYDPKEDCKKCEDCINQFCPYKDSYSDFRRENKGLACSKYVDYDMAFGPEGYYGELQCVAREEMKTETVE